MKTLKFEDLNPAEASFTLSDCPGKVFTLRKFSLAERIWINQRYGKDRIKEIFDTQSLPELCEIAHHLLKDNSEFPTFMAFAQKVISIKDNIGLTQALLKTIGIDDELLKTLAKQVEGNKNPKAKLPKTK